MAVLPNSLTGFSRFTFVTFESKNNSTRFRLQVTSVNVILGGYLTRVKTYPVIVAGNCEIAPLEEAKANKCSYKRQSCY